MQKKSKKSQKNLDISFFRRTFVADKENNRKTTQLKTNNMEQLNHKICVFIPSTFDGNKPAKRMQKAVTKKAAKRFSILFGGATAQQAHGFWNSPEKGLIAEKQNLVFSYCTESQKAANLEKVLTFAKAVCKVMKQEAVTVEIDGVMEFVEA